MNVDFNYIKIKKEKFEKLKSVQVEEEVTNYLKNKFSNLTINICGEIESDIIDLMNLGYLEGWCWQTTESSIVFLNDEDYIERGFLKFEDFDTYFHSWIVFYFKNKAYVFDPCLKILCEKDYYYNLFDVKVIGKCYAIDVIEDMIYRLNNPQKRFYSESTNIFIKKLEKLLEIDKNIKNDELYISGNDDASSAMYRNSTGYKIETENNKIKTLIAHFYNNG